jgi:menaquinone-dependent protoporphyrinogen IX oxidase
LQMGKWTGEQEEFLKKFQNELAGKKTALFVSSAAQSLTEFENKTEEIERNRKYLEEKAAQYNLKPLSMIVFGGVWDFNKMNFIFRKTLSSFKPRIEAAGFKELQPGLYDTRNWDQIRNWAKDLAAKVSSISG